MNYEQKYLKYKAKYIALKNQLGGALKVGDIVCVNGPVNFVKDCSEYKSRYGRVENKIGKIISIDATGYGSPVEYCIEFLEYRIKEEKLAKTSGGVSLVGEFQVGDIVYINGLIEIKTGYPTCKIEFNDVIEKVNVQNQKGIIREKIKSKWEGVFLYCIEFLNETNNEYGKKVFAINVDGCKLTLSYGKMNQKGGDGKSDVVAFAKEKGMSLVEFHEFLINVNYYKKQNSKYDDKGIHNPMIIGEYVVRAIGHRTDLVLQVRSKKDTDTPEALKEKAIVTDNVDIDKENHDLYVTINHLSDY